MNNSNGLSIAGVLGIVFIVLKLVGIINWSWIWVLAPFWISFAIAFLAVLVFILAVCVSKTRR